jgi:hypothetical protein
MPPLNEGEGIGASVKSKRNSKDEKDGIVPVATRSTRQSVKRPTSDPAETKKPEPAMEERPLRQSRRLAGIPALQAETTSKEDGAVLTEKHQARGRKTRQAAKQQEPVPTEEATTSKPSTRPTGETPGTRKKNKAGC